MYVSSNFFHMYFNFKVTWATKIAFHKRKRERESAFPEIIFTQCPLEDDAKLLCKTQRP